ncbi:MAG TPA: ACP phosphodiesterase [Flavisolibacter sp.]|nr:ACP phosphodiesterase [Flavisolibacter sp.]
MNFLAHAYLSFGHPQVLAGNMISDFVKGRAQFSFNGNIQKGIRLHRQIDEFTDTHPATAEAKQVFRPYYRLYSGAIVDIIYDHFLANDPAVFDLPGLKAFTELSYRQLEEQANELPPAFLNLLYYMKRDNWLYNYSGKPGIEKSLNGLVRRAAYLSESDTAYRLFLKDYAGLQACYDAFFPDVKQFAKREFEMLLG